MTGKKTVVEWGIIKKKKMKESGGRNYNLYMGEKLKFIEFKIESIEKQMQLRIFRTVDMLTC